MARIVVMGVAGAGKTTVGRAVAQRLDVPFFDGDDLHAADDRNRMALGEPLDDNRRTLWIERIRHVVEQHDDVVVACSGLRRAHRERLRSVGAVQLFFLDVPADVLEDRLDTRTAHFFPPSLLTSQFDALDYPLADDGVGILDGDQPVDAVVDEIVQAVARAEDR